MKPWSPLPGRPDRSRLRGLGRELVHDIRLAARSAVRKPLFASIVLTVLAVGLGAASAVFDLGWAVFRQPLPVEHPEGLVAVYETRNGRGYHPMSYPSYVDFRRSVRTLDPIAAHYSGAPVQTVSGDRSELLMGSVVSRDFFSLLDVEPALGRFFRPEEFRVTGRYPVVVLSHGLWTRWFQRAPGVLGRTVSLNGVVFEVIGVAPEGFLGVSVGTANDIWIPLAMAEVGYRWCDPFDRGCSYLKLLGRLGAGETIPRARSELSAVAAGLARKHPESNRGVGATVVEARGIEPGYVDLERLLGILGAVVATVVLVASAHLAGLFLARNEGRRRDLAIRSSLGASRGRLAREVVVEALFYSLLGSAASLAVAYVVRGALIPFTGFDEAWLTASPRVPVALFTFGLSMLVGTAFGLGPALAATRIDPVIGPARRDFGSDPRKGRARAFLVTSQVAASLVLLVASGLLVRTLDIALEGNPLASDTVLAFRLRPRLLDVESEKARAIQREVIRRLQRAPGIRAVGAARGFPFFEGPDDADLHVPEAGPVLRDVGLDDVTPGYFATVGLPLIDGREFEERDRLGSPPVAIVNRTLASALWGKPDPVGEVVVANGEAYEVVGVVADAWPASLLDLSRPKLYRPYWQIEGLVDARVCVRTEGPAASYAGIVRSEISEIDPSLPVSEMETLETKVGNVLRPLGLARDMAAFCGTVSLLLVWIGLYGMMALFVEERRREIAVRIAVGAGTSTVVRYVVGHALRVVLLGIGLALPATFALSRLFSGFLYGAAPMKPAGLVTATLLLVSAAALATYRPVRRAAGIDPMTVLRED